jgi:signal transduction histidine kinase
LYLLVSDSAEIAQTVVPRRLLGAVLLWTLPIAGIRLRRAADTIQLLNNDLDSKVTASGKKLRLTMARLNEAQRLTGFGNWEVRTDTGEVWWSQQTYLLLGLDPSASTACINSFIECVHADDRVRVREAMDEIREKGRPYSITYRVRRPDDTVRHFRDQAAAEFDDDGGITRIVGTIQDVSDQIELEHEVIAISERERMSIGHDLHDTLAQDLTALTLLIKNVESSLGKKTRASEEGFQQLYEIASNAIATTRALAVGLSPVQIGDIGLVAGLERVAAHARSLYRIDCSVNVAGRIPVGDGIHARQVYRIVQEAVTNAARHADASKITIFATNIGGRFRVEIMDDGIGFVPPSTAGAGMGLRIMEYRARRVGGDLSVSRRDEGGTVVLFTCQWAS